MICDVAVSAPVRGLFSYALDTEALGRPEPGTRVWVPFGRGQRMGVVVSCRDRTSDDDLSALKPITELLDDVPRVDPPVLALARWAASYYHHPLGEIIAATLPTVLRRRRWKAAPVEHGWRLTETGRRTLAEGAALGHRQQLVIERFDGAEVCKHAAFGDLDFDWRAALRRLVRRGWVERVATAEVSPASPAATPVALNAEQRLAADAVVDALGSFAAFVLHGVTGSGKTEVYFECIERCLRDSNQVLVLVPEIALTGQLVARFRERFGARVQALHSGLSDRQRALTWLDCTTGRCEVLIGTRSAVWVGLPRLELIIVDEEHDASYKQQDGFRYSARDVAIMRARMSTVPVVLGSATPALETLANVERGKYTRLRLTRRALAQSVPSIEPLDVRGHHLEGGLSETLLNAMAAHLERGEQVMLFLNRRGYAPLLMCRSCGEPRRCESCDAYYVFHKGLDVARCHHCDRQISMRRPAGCCEQPDIAPIGLGTERLEEVVATRFPTRRICRMDRDTVRHAAALDDMLGDIAAGRIDILIGTQMVAKGFDFGAITLVGIVDADSRLYALDFRAEERLAQLLIQVAGRAGRADKPGRVLIQTHQPQHPVLRRIIEQGYDVYAQTALAERAEAALPPFVAMAIIRAESNRAERPLAFLGAARQSLASLTDTVDISYPIPALMERRAGRYRALIVLSAPQRSSIGEALTAGIATLEQLARSHRVRFAIDIDPQDTL